MSLEPFYLAGPTAVGKSDLAAEIAARGGGEIIGADAFQVYRGLDLLTAKPDSATRERVPHHLIGEIPLTESFDVAKYRARAADTIEAVCARGRRPIVAGGTGLYLRALTHGLANLPEPNLELREQLGQQPIEQLLERLHQLDPESAARIDPKNPRRIIRALEVCLLSGRPFSSFREQWSDASAARGAVILRDRDDLYERIERRTVQMFAAGVVDEVRAVEAIGPTAAQAIGFKDIRALIEGRMSESECIATIQQQTRHYAKRQMTWFRREQHLQPILWERGASAESIVEQVLALIDAD